MSENGSVNLSPRQHRAILALLAQPTVAAASVASGVGQSTIYKWLGEAAFRTALAQAEGAAVAAAGRRLVALAEAALDTVATVMTNPQAPDAVRVRAAETILSNLIRYRELVNFETRLDALEREVRGENDA